MIQVIEDKKPWDEFISSFEHADLYHTFDYHLIAKDGGKPVLLKYTCKNITIGLPLLIRNIPNSPYKDATSVYGYAGPIYKNITDNFDGIHFNNELLEYFKANNIVSVFSRLNPFLPLQHKILKNTGSIDKKGPIVIIDLTKNIEVQRQEFGKRLKGQLNKARRCSHVIKAKSDDDLQKFITIYHENMDRVNAKSMYYFEDEYFRAIAKSKSFKTETFLAIHNETGDIMGASMFFYKDSTVHYHLSGTKTEYLPMMPTKLLIDEMRLKASELGLTHFNLGGGLSGSDDSLLQFKSSFSKNMKDFYVWKLIVDADAYHNITKECSAPVNSDFFPLYRCSNQLVFSAK
jgi:lipid II:glycine glycyltransferase (peptidoglycan interpeptide bridge formation enzyme)